MNGDDDNNNQNVQFLKNFIEILVEVYRLQCGIEVIVSSSQRLAPDQNWEETRKLHLYSLACMTVNGDKYSVAFCFSKESFLKYVSSMFGETFSELSEEICDLVSEWLNITIGHTRAKYMDEMNITFESTIPATILGENLTVYSHEQNVLLVHKATSQLGDFYFLYREGDTAILPWTSMPFA